MVLSFRIRHCKIHFLSDWRTQFLTVFFSIKLTKLVLSTHLLTRNVQLRKKMTLLYNLHKLHVIQTNQKTPRGSGKQEGQGQENASSSRRRGGEPRWERCSRSAPRPVRGRSAPPRAPHRHRHGRGSPAAPAPAETEHVQHRAILQSGKYFQEAFHWELNIFNYYHVINSLQKG